MKDIEKKQHNRQYQLSEEQYTYLDYGKNNLPQWYNDFSFHDSKIIKIKSFDNLMVLDLIADDYKETKYKIKFYNPKIIEECNLLNAWCISNELYLNDNSCEFHLLADEMLKRYRKGDGFTFYHYMIDLDAGPCIVKSRLLCVYVPLI